MMDRSAASGTRARAPHSTIRVSRRSKRLDARCPSRSEPGWALRDRSSSRLPGPGTAAAGSERRGSVVRPLNVTCGRERSCRHGRRVEPSLSTPTRRTMVRSGPTSPRLRARSAPVRRQLVSSEGWSRIMCGCQVVAGGRRVEPRARSSAAWRTATRAQQQRREGFAERLPVLPGEVRVGLRPK